MKTVYTNPPTHCDLCRSSLENCVEFYDAALRAGPWANICPDCFKFHAIGLGPGKGQHYKRDNAGQYVKVAG